MPVRLGETEFNELLGETDPFKLAVLGLAAIEAEFDAAIEEAFMGEVPRELRARWGIKLALVIALGLLPQHFRGFFDRLATLRNRFAHGEIHTLTRQHANALVEEIRARFPETTKERGDELGKILESSPPILSLKVALFIARDTFSTAAGAARKAREEDRQIVLVHRVLRNRRAALRALADVETESDP